jgi:hypothetical protein
MAADLRGEIGSEPHQFSPTRCPSLHGTSEGYLCANRRVSVHHLSQAAAVTRNNGVT